MSDELPTLLLPAEVGAILRMTENEVLEMTQNAQMPYVMFPDGTVLIRREDVRRFINKHTMGAFASMPGISFGG